MKKILIVAHEYNLGGATHSLLDIIDELTLDSEYQVSVIIPKHVYKKSTPLSKKLSERKVDFLEYYYCFDPDIRKNLKSQIKTIIYFLLNILKLKKYKLSIFMEQGFDIIHTNSSVTDFGLKLSKKYKIKHIWHVRENLEGMFKKTNKEMQKWYEKAFDSNSYFVFITENLLKEYEKQSDYLIKKKTVIYNGIKLNEYNNDCYKDKPITNIYNFGRIQQTKNQIDLIEAASILSTKISGFSINFVGQNSGEYFKKMEKRILELNLNEKINFLGYCENVNELRTNAGIEVLCSENEAFGRVIIEGMAARSVVVATDIGGPKEIMSNNVDGFLYSPGNYEQLSEILLQIINMKKNDREEMIVNATKTAERYSIISCVKKIKEIYG